MVNSTDHYNLVQEEHLLQSACKQLAKESYVYTAFTCLYIIGKLGITKPKQMN